MLISKDIMSIENKKEKNSNTGFRVLAAYLALRLAWGEIDVEVVPFDEIMPRVLSGEFEVGLIIHEGQVTWKNEGVHLIQDLGIWWNKKTGLPLPLGGNIVRKDLGIEVCEKITEDVKNSIIWSIENPESSLEFAKNGVEA